MKYITFIFGWKDKNPFVLFGTYHKFSFAKIPLWWNHFKQSRSKNKKTKVVIILIVIIVNLFLYTVSQTQKAILASQKIGGKSYFIFGGKRIEIKNINSKIEDIEKNLKVHVQKLALDIGERNFIKYEALEKAGNYIISEFSKYGYTSELQKYQIEKKEYKNIIVRLKGNREPERIIIIGAHYDSVVGTPGADDNASAVAGLLELARLINLTKKTPAKTIKFIAFTNEEPPFFQSEKMGSIIYAQEAKRRKEKIDAMICLEMIGYFRQEKNSQSYPFPLNFFYPDTGNFIAVVGNIASKELVNKVTSTFRKNSNFPIESISTCGILPGIDFSDHASFWRYGYKAVMITDTAFYRNPNYHSHTDLPHTLNYQDLAEVVKGLYYVILELAR